ncbi:MAG: nucleoside hydrolase [Oscillospiraceae bacterium]|nr:nucleoside hydrolase [Oscillospiraceae bacterium]
MRKIILDVDTGSDDAVAIMSAILSKDIQLEAVCSVAGNKDIDKTTENTLRVVQLMGADVPVYRGCREPLVKFLCPDRLPAREGKGPLVVDGKVVQMHADYLDIPKARRKEEAISAPEFYVQYLRRAKEPVTIVAVGPLTNVAAALLLDGTIVDKIEEIVIMGGGYNITNVTPTAEFNIWYDPEAAQRVIHCGAKVTLVPLDATHAACITRDDCRRFRALGTVPGDFAAALCEQRILVHNNAQPLAVPDAAAVHDALCIAYLIDPAVLKDVRRVHCDVGFRDFCEGQTILDMRYYTEPVNCSFAFGGDRFRFADILCDLFASGEKVKG